MRARPDKAPLPRTVTVPLLMGLFVLSFIPVSIVLPAVSSISQELRTTPNVVQTSLTVFLMGLGIAQLFYGPLSDRFGRRPVLLVGLVIFVIGSVACATSSTIEMFIWARFVQAMGAAAGASIGRAIIQDAFGSTNSVRVLANTIMATTLAGAMSPVAGNLLYTMIGWRAIFVFLAVAGIAIFAMLAVSLPETRVIQESGPDDTPERALSLLKNESFLRNMLFSCMLFGSWYGFIAGSPIVIIQSWGFSSTTFAIWWMIVSAFYFVGNYLASYLSGKYPPSKIIRWGSIQMGLVTLVLLALAVADIRHPVAVFLPVSILLIGFAAAQTNAVALAVAARPRLAGTASGIMGSFQILCGMASTLLVGSVSNETSLNFIAIFATLVALAILSYALPVGSMRKRTMPRSRC